MTSNRDAAGPVPTPPPQTTPPDVGSRLRDARRRRGLSLGEVGASTKISPHILERIDRSRFSELPGGILTKGHLRAYAAAVGLDPEEIVRQYVGQHLGDGAEDPPFTPPRVPRPSGRSRRWLVRVMLVVALGALLYWQARSVDRGVDQAVDAPVAIARVYPVSETYTRETPARAALDVPPREPPLHLEVRADGPCWLSATADDRLVVHRLLQQGDRVVATAHEQLVLRVGDPETFVYWMNGLPGTRLGPAATPVTVRITIDNLNDYIRPSASPAV